MNLIEDSKMSLLNFNFFMIYKMLVLLKYHLNYLKDNIFIIFFLIQVFLQHMMMIRLSLNEENIIKDTRNLFRLKKK